MTKFSKWIENTANFYFSHSVFKRIVPQTRENQGLFGKGLKGKNSLISIDKLELKMESSDRSND